MAHPVTQPARTPERELSLRLIVDAAIDIADREGLDALSMRKVATALGVGTMSLYRHAENKDALIAAMSETVMAATSYPEPPDGDWREAMRTAARSDVAVYRRHPWMLLTANAPRYLSDTECLGWMMRALAPLTTDRGLSRTFALSVWSYVMGSTLGGLSRLLLPGANLAPSQIELGERDFELGLEMLLDGFELRVAGS